MSRDGLRFNPPPDWPQPPEGWTPPAGWTPDPAWPDPPDGWNLWLPADAETEPRAPEESIVEASPPASSNAASEDESDAATSQRLAVLESENAALRAQLDDAVGSTEELIVLDDERVLQSVGIYRYPIVTYPFEQGRNH